MRAKIVPSLLIVLCSCFVFPMIVHNAAGSDVININDLAMRDPQIMLHDDTYYLTGTTSDHEYLIYSSQDLVSWKNEKTAFDVEPSWVTGCFWSAELSHDGVFYMAFTGFQANGLHGVGIARSMTPAGGYLDLLNNPITPVAESCIDGNIFIDNGKKYLLYSIDPDSSHIVVQELSADYTQLLGEPKTIITVGESWSSSLVEGPAMLFYNNKYWVFWSSYNPVGYAIGYSYADTIMGDYTHAETPLLNADCGGASILFKKDAVLPSIVYHQPNSISYDLDYERVIIRDLLFSDTGVSIVEPTFSVSWWWYVVIPAILVGIVWLVVRRRKSMSGSRHAL